MYKVPALGGGFERLKTLLDGGADVNAPDKWGNTPLHVAARLCRSAYVQILIDAGADKTLENTDGATPFGVLWALLHGPRPPVLCPPETVLALRPK